MVCKDVHYERPIGRSLFGAVDFQVAANFGPLNPLGAAALHRIIPVGAERIATEIAYAIVRRRVVSCIAAVEKAPGEKLNPHDTENEPKEATYGDYVSNGRYTVY